MKSGKFTLDPLIDVLSGALFDTKQLGNRDGYETTTLAGYESSEYESSVGTKRLVSQFSSPAHEKQKKKKRLRNSEIMRLAILY